VATHGIIIAVKSGCENGGAPAADRRHPGRGAARRLLHHVPSQFARPAGDHAHLEFTEVEDAECRGCERLSSDGAGNHHLSNVCTPEDDLI